MNTYFFSAQIHVDILPSSQCIILTKTKCSLVYIKIVPKLVGLKTCKSNPVMTGLGCLMFALINTAKWGVLIFQPVTKFLISLKMFKAYQCNDRVRAPTCNCVLPLSVVTAYSK